MSADSDVTVARPAGPCYRVQVQGGLGVEWSEWFAGMSVMPQPDGTTAIVGPLPDQAALYGVLERVRDLGLTLLALERTAEA